MLGIRVVRATFAAVGLTAVMVACGGGGTSSDGADPGEPFRFEASTGVDMVVTVTKFGVPVAGATVQLAEVHPGLESESDQAETFFRGGTDPDGRVDVTLQIPTSETRFDVVIQHAGSQGPFTDESLRTAWGAFSPSARITIDRELLSAVVIELEDAE